MEWEFYGAVYPVCLEQPVNQHYQKSLLRYIFKHFLPRESIFYKKKNSKIIFLFFIKIWMSIFGDNNYLQN